MDSHFGISSEWISIASSSPGWVDWHENNRMEGLPLKHINHDKQHYLRHFLRDWVIPPGLEMDYMIQLIYTAEKHHSFKNEQFLLIL